MVKTHMGWVKRSIEKDKEAEDKKKAQEEQKRLRAQAELLLRQQEMAARLLHGVTGLVGAAVSPGAASRLPHGRSPSPTRGPSGPNLPRTRTDTELYLGTVVEWKGSYGWIQPSEPIRQNGVERRHGGKVYAARQDIMAGNVMGAGLTPGQLVQFRVYTDASGVGAEQVRVLSSASPAATSAASPGTATGVPPPPPPPLRAALAGEDLLASAAVNGIANGIGQPFSPGPVAAAGPVAAVPMAQDLVAGALLSAGLPGGIGHLLGQPAALPAVGQLDLMGGALPLLGMGLAPGLGAPAGVPATHLGVVPGAQDLAIAGGGAGGVGTPAGQFGATLPFSAAELTTEQLVHFGVLAASGANA